MSLYHTDNTTRSLFLDTVWFEGGQAEAGYGSPGDSAVQQWHFKIWNLWFPVFIQVLIWIVSWQEFD